MSIDKFYELVFGDSTAFFKLCMALPDIIEDVINEDKTLLLKNTVYEELSKKNTDLLKAIYLLAFSTYEGFQDIQAQ